MSNYPSQKKALNRLKGILNAIEAKQVEIDLGIEFNRGNSFPELAENIGKLRTEAKELETKYTNLLPKLKL